MFLIEIQNGKKYYFPILNKHTYLNISINNIYIYMVYIIFYIRHVKMDIHIYTLKPFTLMIYIYIYIYTCVLYTWIDKGSSQNLFIKMLFDFSLNNIYIYIHIYIYIKHIYIYISQIYTIYVYIYIYTYIFIHNMYIVLWCGERTIYIYIYIYCIYLGNVSTYSSFSATDIF